MSGNIVPFSSEACKALERREFLAGEFQDAFKTTQEVLGGLGMRADHLGKMKDAVNGYVAIEYRAESKDNGVYLDYHDDDDKLSTILLSPIEVRRRASLIEKAGFTDAPLFGNSSTISLARSWLTQEMTFSALDKAFIPEEAKPIASYLALRSKNVWLKKDLQDVNYQMWLSQGLGLLALSALAEKEISARSKPESAARTTAGFITRLKRLDKDNRVDPVLEPPVATSDDFATLFREIYGFIKPAKHSN